MFLPCCCQCFRFREIGSIKEQGSFEYSAEISDIWHSLMLVIIDWCRKLMFRTVVGEIQMGEKHEDHAICLFHNPLQLSGDNKPRMICGAEITAVLWTRHESLMEQNATAVQCPWQRIGNRGRRRSLLQILEVTLLNVCHKCHKKC